MHSDINVYVYAQNVYFELVRWKLDFIVIQIGTGGNGADIVVVVVVVVGGGGGGRDIDGKVVVTVTGLTECYYNIMLQQYVSDAKPNVVVHIMNKRENFVYQQ